jgi:hypothetical protein
MQRYHFHFKWRDDAVFDEEGIKLRGSLCSRLRIGAAGAKAPSC